MEIVAIFAIVKNSLLSVHFADCEYDEFALLFDKWSDVEFLEQFFEENKDDLQSGFWGNISVEEAVLRTLKEAEKMEEFIMEIIEASQSDSDITLHDFVFKPLSKNDFSIQHTKSKSYGPDKPSWLRLYAIQIASNLYVVSGGAIKLTQAMNEKAHLVHELKKLQATKEYLEQIGLLNEEDYEFIEIMNHNEG